MKMAKKVTKPAPRLPVKPAPVNPGTRGNVETNYRGIPGLVNATAPVPALGKKPTPSIPTPVKPGGGRTMRDILLGRGSPAKPVGPGPGLGGGAGMARPATDLSRAAEAARARSMMKKGGAVKKAAAKKGKK